MKKGSALCVLVILLVLMMTGCGLTVPRPEIKSEEFDFSVTYEYGGETKTVSGVFVCEYAGTSWTLDGGYGRDWTGHIQGGELEDHVPIDTVDGNEIILVLNLDPEYLMDDFNADLYDIPKPYIMVKMVSDEGMWFVHDPGEIEEYCGAKIISYEYDEPIENSFGLFK